MYEKLNGSNLLRTKIISFTKICTELRFAWRSGSVIVQPGHLEELITEWTKTCDL
jgi:hypothetical protein